jgi:AP-3 complex subunit beta
LVISLLSLDQDQKEELIQVLEKLLSDKTTLVVGSAVMAFEEVCPDRVDLIHKNYRKLCSLLVDVDEWGQVVIINMLTRYARSQFTDPNINVRNIRIYCFT